MNILIVGSGAREHALAKALDKSPSSPEVYYYGTTHNPGMKKLVKSYVVGPLNNSVAILEQALAWHIDLTIVGPEGPLENGLVDLFKSRGLATVGPGKHLARIETSKSFTRELLKAHQIDASPNFKQFQSLEGVESYLRLLGKDQFVIKADGLMGGKGVKVAGEHLHSIEEGLNYCRMLAAQNFPFIIEEKLIGQEFSLIALTDGETLVPMPVVQDHKRAYVGDTGPNTGGMGSYSDQSHSMPFLTAEDIEAANEINQRVLTALQSTCHDVYRGFLYGSFIATKDGVRLIEYNARLGDPEAINLLSILDADFVEICQAMATGLLKKDMVHFLPKATVCKYVVPEGYPDHPQKDFPIDVSDVSDIDGMFYGSVNELNGQIFAAGSRAIAVVGVADTLEQAEQQAEQSVAQIKGNIFHRQDIGTAALIQERMNMMKSLRSELCA